MTPEQSRRRRTVDRVRRAYAARLRPGDLVHTPSEVMLVEAVAVDLDPTLARPSGVVTASVLGEHQDCTGHRYDMKWDLRQELQVYSPPREAQQ